MNLKILARKLLLWAINLLYYPNVLGYWSDNNTGGFVITNKACTKYRSFGHPTWTSWNNNPPYPRVYNEDLKLSKPEDFDHRGISSLLQKDYKAISFVIDRLLEKVQIFLLLVFLVNFFTKSIVINNIFETIFIVTTFFRLITVVIKYKK